MKLEKILNTGKRFLGTSLLIGSLVSPLSARNAQSQEPNKRYFFDLGIRYETSLINEIKNMPLKIRDVPKHPGDIDVPDENIAPIEDASIKLYDRISIGTKTGINLYPHNKFKIGLGFGLDLDLNAPLLLGRFKYDDRKDTRKRNYTTQPGTDKRGYNAALTYYQVHSTFGPNWNDCIIPSIYSEIEFRVTDKVGFALGCNIYKQTLTAENGWDRGNSLEPRKKYNLANLTIVKPCTSLRFYNEKTEQYIALELGLFNLRTNKPTDIGKEININFNDLAVFGGIRMGSKF